MAQDGTIGGAVNELTMQFEAGGLDTPRLDARILVGHVAGLEPSLLFARSDQALTPEQDAVLRAFAGRRLAHEPVSRILGRRAFWGLEFELNAATLDPRPDTETIVSAAIALSLPAGANILDLGTGTGCILIAILSELPQARGLGIDQDARAVEAARGNAERLGVAPRARFQVGNWCEGLSETFDLIASNPPYIGDTETLDPEVADFDPPAALFAGPDGLGAYRILIPAAKERLAASGRLILEIGVTQQEAVESLLNQAGFALEARMPDLSGRVRVLIARSG